MERRNYLKSMGVATGVLATGGGNVTAEERSVDGDVEYDDGWSGPPIRTADDLAALSTDERQELPNELVKRPFNPEIGGGEEYDPDEFEAAEDYPHGGSVTASDADFVVETADEMHAALGQAVSGDVVWVPGDAVIDATGQTFEVPSGVTVASDRGRNGSSGGRVFKSEPTSEWAIFVPQGNDCRFTGLHLHGGQEGFWTLEERGVDSIYGVGLSMGVWIRGDTSRTEIDNCLMHGFSYCGVRVGFFDVSGTYIHHNEIVDIPAPQLGYGVTIYDADPMIEYNYFDATRHAIAGYGGYLGTEYTARHNLFGPRTRLHVLDMHGGEDPNWDGECQISGWLSDYVENWVAGSMTIENNVVLATTSMRPDSDFPQEAVVVRGTPRNTVEVRNNWFFQPSPPFSDLEHEPRLGGTIAGDRGDAITQWYVDHYCGIDASNNICEGAHPTNDIGLEAQWNPDAGRSGSGAPDWSGSPAEGDGPEKGEVPENADPVKEMRERKNE